MGFYNRVSCVYRNMYNSKYIYIFARTQEVGFYNRVSCVYVYIEICIIANIYIYTYSRTDALVVIVQFYNYKRYSHS